jgi:hypothetical protein
MRFKAIRKQAKNSKNKLKKQAIRTLAKTFGDENHFSDKQSPNKLLYQQILLTCPLFCMIDGTKTKLIPISTLLPSRMFTCCFVVNEPETFCISEFGYFLKFLRKF